MKINKLVKVGDRIEVRNVEMTSEEIAEYERHQAEIIESEPTPEERMAIMEDAFAELCEVIFNG